MKLVHILALCVLAAASPAAAKHRTHARSYHADIILLKGSPLKLALENRRADHAHLPRYTEKTMKVKKQVRELVPIPQNRALRIDRRLPPEYRYCRPETVTFLLNISSAFRSKFGRPLTVTSCVRSLERQEHLKRVNGNAARGGNPDRRSLHLTGLAADITKVGMNARQQNWMRSFLLQETRRGRVDPTEEHHQDCFHVVVNPVRADKPHKHTRHHGPPA